LARQECFSVFGHRNLVDDEVLDLEGDDWNHGGIR
jgi:hypothetical protein